MAICGGGDKRTDEMVLALLRQAEVEPDQVALSYSRAPVQRGGAVWIKLVYTHRFLVLPVPGYEVQFPFEGWARSQRHFKS